MTITRRYDPAEAVRLAIISFDEQIAELQETRARLAALINQPSRVPAVKVAAPQKRRKLSAAAKAKISTASKARWERERKEKAQKPKTPAKKALPKGKPAKARSAPAKAKKEKSESPTSATKAKGGKAS
jgi:hypothetical protein